MLARVGNQSVGPMWSSLLSSLPDLKLTRPPSRGDSITKIDPTPKEVSINYHSPWVGN